MAGELGIAADDGRLARCEVVRDGLGSDGGGEGQGRPKHHAEQDFCSIVKQPTIGRLGHEVASL